VEIFVKDLIQFYNSKREKKSLSSGDFVTAAGMVQQNHEVKPLDDRTTMNLVWCSECSASEFLQPVQFARLPWVIYTSHSSYCYYCTY
jgi:hypothetical protein